MMAACTSYAYAVCGLTFDAPGGIWDYDVVSYKSIDLKIYLFIGMSRKWTYCRHNTHSLL